MGGLIEMDGPRANPITEADLSNERTLADLARSYARKHDELCERILRRLMAGADVEGGAAADYDQTVDRVTGVKKTRLLIDGRCVYERLEGSERRLRVREP